MSSADVDDRPSRMTWRWLAGLVVGATGALLLVLAGTLGIAAWALLIVSLVVRPDRPPALAGLPVGLGAVILVLLLRAALACRPGECVAPDVTGWIVLASCCLAAGGLATIGLVMGARRT
jgi:hypothetical protein